MSGRAVCVRALGMVSALGHDVVTSCAAARAGLSRASELKGLSQPFGKLTLDGPPVMHGHQATGIADGFSGAGKVLALGSAALRDLLTKTPIEPRDAMRSGLFLCLSDYAVIDAHHRELSEVLGASDEAPSVSWRAKTRDLATRLAIVANLDVREAHCTVMTEGSPGFVRALEKATAEIAQGTLDRCLVGAVGSRVEPGFLTAAAGLSMLRTNDRPVGLIGGEAGAFVLLERVSSTAYDEPLPSIVGFGFGAEELDHFAGSAGTGRALSGAITAALAQSPTLGESLSMLIGELNGTERRAYEWGNALARLGDAGIRVDLPVWYPATSFGDTGAAASAVGLCVAVRAFQRGYAKGRGALIWAHSESGASAAFGVESGR